MIIVFLNKIQKSLPKPIKNIAESLCSFIPFSLRYGKFFRKQYGFLQKSQWWSREQIEKYQFEKLTKLLHHAYKNVPYYKNIFDERNLKPSDIKSLQDLKKIPILTKKSIQDQLPNLLAKNIPSHRLQYVTTGGSTGIPLGIYIENGVTNAKEWAFVWTQWAWAGYKFKDKKVVLRGDLIDRFINGKRAWWQHDFFNRALILSSYEMTDANLKKYIEKIKKFNPDIIQGYPSTIEVIAKYMQNHLIEINGIKAVLTSSENLYPAQRKLIESQFKAPIFDLYGHIEGTIMAAECEMHNGYHIFPEYGIIELIDKNGTSVTNDGEIGEIVATGFNNLAVPLIRYKTMDLAVYSKSKCKCGREYPLLKRIEGRLQEFIVTKNGKLISMTAVNMHSGVFDNVRQFQFYQDKKGEVIFNIVKKTAYSDGDTDYITKELKKKIGEDVNLKIRFVDNVPRTKTGKYQFLIQKLPIS